MQLNSRIDTFIAVLAICIMIMAMLFWFECHEKHMCWHMCWLYIKTRQTSVIVFRTIKILVLYALYLSEKID